VPGIEVEKHIVVVDQKTAVEQETVVGTVAEPEDEHVGPVLAEETTAAAG
jgi:hypothetical protein